MPCDGSSVTRRERARAKLNLALRVLGRRPDGYHELETVFQAIDLHDDIEVTLRRGGARSVVLSCDRADLEHEGNLAWRAADLLLRRLDLDLEVRIRLRKRIPAGAGLGGGSSDAAAVLRAMAALLRDAPARADLVAVAEALGSDVPFFLLGGTAFGTGRGTCLAPLPDLPPYPLALVLPEVEVSTAWAYGALATARSTGLTEPGKPGMIEKLGPSLGRLARGDATAFSDWMVNDFEGLVFQRFPDLGEVRRRLLACGARRALMSGSGAAVFGLFDSVQRAEEAAARLGAGGLRTRACCFAGREAGERS